jgi:hypothetical protein
VVRGSNHQAHSRKNKKRERFKEGIGNGTIKTKFKPLKLRKSKCHVAA